MIKLLKIARMPFQAFKTLDFGPDLDVGVTTWSQIRIESF